jgi:hypothetical protein
MYSVRYYSVGLGTYVLPVDTGELLYTYIYNSKICFWNVFVHSMKWLEISVFKNWNNFISKTKIKAQTGLTCSLQHNRSYVKILKRSNTVCSWNLPKSHTKNWKKWKSLRKYSKLSANDISLKNIRGTIFAIHRIVKVTLVRVSKVYFCNEEQCVFCAVVTEFSITIAMNLSLRRDDQCWYQIDFNLHSDRLADRIKPDTESTQDLEKRDGSFEHVPNPIFVQRMCSK